MPQPKAPKTKPEDVVNADLVAQEPARTRDEAAAAAVAPDQAEDTWFGKPPTKAAFNADPPVVDVQGGVVVLSVGGNDTALSHDDVIRLGKQLSAAAQQQTAQVPDADR